MPPLQTNLEKNGAIWKTLTIFPSDNLLAQVQDLDSKQSQLHQYNYRNHRGDMFFFKIILFWVGVWKGVSPGSKFKRPVQTRPNSGLDLRRRKVHTVRHMENLGNNLEKGFKLKFRWPHFSRFQSDMMSVVFGIPKHWG